VCVIDRTRAHAHTSRGRRPAWTSQIKSAPPAPCRSMDHPAGPTRCIIRVSLTVQRRTTSISRNKHSARTLWATVLPHPIDLDGTSPRPAAGASGADEQRHATQPPIRRWIEPSSSDRCDACLRRSTRTYGYHEHGARRRSRRTLAMSLFHQRHHHRLRCHQGPAMAAPYVQAAGGAAEYVNVRTCTHKRRAALR
jgi:hypothetical protein